MGGEIDDPIALDVLTEVPSCQKIRIVGGRAQRLDQASHRIRRDCAAIKARPIDLAIEMLRGRRTWMFGTGRFGGQ